MKISKIGNVELSEGTAQKFYEQKKYICSYTGIYQIHFSQAQNQYYGSRIINYKGYARRGRFFAQTAAEINHVFGEKILNED